MRAAKTFTSAVDGKNPWMRVPETLVKVKWSHYSLYQYFSRLRYFAPKRMRVLKSLGDRET
jgi:hypothetical protein